MKFGWVLASQRCIEFLRAFRNGAREREKTHIIAAHLPGRDALGSLTLSSVIVSFGGIAVSVFTFVSRSNSFISFRDSRLTPHYPAKSPLDDVLRYVEPGSDEYKTEKYTAEIAQRLEEWGQELRANPTGLKVLARFLDGSLKATPLVPTQEQILRSGNGITAIRRKFSNEPLLGRERFLEEMRVYLAPLRNVETAEFQIAEIEMMSDSPLKVRIKIRYDLVGKRGSHRTRGTHRILADGMYVRRLVVGELTVGRRQRKLSAAHHNRFFLM